MCLVCLWGAGSVSFSEDNVLSSRFTVDFHSEILPPKDQQVIKAGYCGDNSSVNKRIKQEVSGINFLLAVKEIKFVVLCVYFRYITEAKLNSILAEPGTRGCQG